MSAIDAVRTDTHPVDIYYQDGRNQGVAAVDTECTTRFVQTLSNLSSGQSTILIPPQDGLRQVLCVLGYSKQQVQDNSGGAFLCRGWGYEAIRSVTWRVGASNTFTLTGKQLLARNLRLVRSQTQKDAILSLGGQACTTAADFRQDGGLYAYVPLTFFNPPSSDELTLPVASDLLSSQIVIQVELNPPSAFWRINPTPGAFPGYVIPSGFDKGYVQTEQILMKNKADSLAVQYDLNERSYIQTMVPFDQTAFTYDIPAQTGLQTITATGFRSGRMKEFQIFLLRKSDALNPSLMYAPRSVQIQYSGQFYSFFNDGTAAMWALLDGTSAPAANTVKFSLAPGGGNVVASPALNTYAICKFAQPTGWDYATEVNSMGKVIANASVQVSVELPWTPVDANDGATMVLIPVLDNVLAYTRGTADYVF